MGGQGSRGPSEGGGQVSAGVGRSPAQRPRRRRGNTVREVQGGGSKGGGEQEPTPHPGAEAGSQLGQSRGSRGEGSTGHPTAPAARRAAARAASSHHSQPGEGQPRLAAGAGRKAVQAGSTVQAAAGPGQTCPQDEGRADRGSRSWGAQGQSTPSQQDPGPRAASLPAAQGGQGWALPYIQEEGQRLPVRGRKQKTKALVCPCPVAESWGRRHDPGERGSAGASARGLLAPRERQELSAAPAPGRSQ